MNKKDKSLITVTIVLVIALIFGIVWDMNKFVLKRTLDFEISSDMSIESMHKYGIMFYRKAYETKFHVNAAFAERTVNYLASALDQEPEIMSYEEYMKYAETAFNREVNRPNPLEGTEVVVFKTTTSDGNYATFMMDMESQNDAYVYLYFAR